MSISYGGILHSQDSAVNTPVVPNANTTPEYKSSIWIRNVNSSDSVNRDRLYLWLDNATDDPTFLKWKELKLPVEDGSIPGTALADSSVAAGKLAGGIGISLLNLLNALDDTHIDALTSAKIANLSGTNTGDQALAYTPGTGVLQLSGDTSKTINAVPTWNSGTKTLTWTYGSVTLSGLSTQDNTTQQVLVTDDRFAKLDPTSQSANTWRQISLLDKTLTTPAAQQPSIVLAASGDYIVSGQVGITVAPAFTATSSIEIGLVNVTSDANAVTPVNKTLITRKSVTRHDAIQFHFVVPNPSTSQTWRLVWRAVDTTITDDFPTSKWPTDYVTYDAWETYGTPKHWFEGDTTFIKAVRLN